MKIKLVCMLSTGATINSFDAPVGLIFTIDRVMQQGSWLDYGMFLQNIMVAARGRGLDNSSSSCFHTVSSHHSASISISEMKKW